MTERSRNKENRGLRERVWCRGEVSLKGGECHGGEILGKSSDRRVMK